MKTIYEKKKTLNMLNAFVESPHSNSRIFELNYDDLTYFVYKPYEDVKALIIIIKKDWIPDDKKSEWLMKYLMIDKKMKINKKEISNWIKDNFVSINEIKDCYVNLQIIDLSIETKNNFKSLLYEENELKKFHFINENYLESKYEISTRKSTDMTIAFKRTVDRGIFKKHYTKKIGIISPFTYGKSALLNSLLSTNLLQEDILVKTAKITSITANKDFWLFKENPKVLIENYKEKDTFKERLGYLSTLNEKGSHRIDATIKNLIPNNLTYVDTPGLFGRFGEHDDITEKMIADLDFVIYLLNPTQLGFEPYTNKILEWQRKYNKPCIFVMNKMDLVKTTEDRNKLHDEFEKTLSQKVKHQGIFYVSAYSALKARLYKKGQIDLIDLKKDPLIFVIEDDWIVNGRAFTHEHIEALERASGIFKLEKFINQI